MVFLPLQNSCFSKLLVLFHMDNEGKIPNLENDTYNYNLNLIFCTEKDVYLTFLFYSKKSTSRSIIPFFTMKQVPSLTNNIYSVCLIVIDLLCSTLHRKASTKTPCFHFSCAQKMMFFSKDFFTKCDQIRTFLWVWSHLLKKSSQKNFIFVQCSEQPGNRQFHSENDDHRTINTHQL